LFKMCSAANILERLVFREIRYS